MVVWRRVGRKRAGGEEALVEGGGAKPYVREAGRGEDAVRGPRGLGRKEGRSWRFMALHGLISVQLG